MMNYKRAYRVAITIVLLSYTFLFNILNVNKTIQNSLQICVDITQNNFLKINRSLIRRYTKHRESIVTNKHIKYLINKINNKKINSKSK